MRLLLPCLCLAALVGAAPALAGDIQVGLGLHGGGLSVQAPSAAALAGKSVEIPVTVADARGNGAGWTLDVDASSPVTITGISARCASNSTCTLPRATAGDGILRAATDSGMGVIQLVVTVAPLRSGSTSVPLTFRIS
jgi:hypothetical protein